MPSQQQTDGNAAAVPAQAPAVQQGTCSETPQWKQTAAHTADPGRQAAALHCPPDAIEPECPAQLQEAKIVPRMPAVGALKTSG